MHISLCLPCEKGKRPLPVAHFPALLVLKISSAVNSYEHVEDCGILSSTTKCHK